MLDSASKLVSEAGGRIRMAILHTISMEIIRLTSMFALVMPLIPARISVHQPFAIAILRGWSYCKMPGKSPRNQLCQSQPLSMDLLSSRHRLLQSQLVVCNVQVHCIIIHESNDSC